MKKLLLFYFTFLFTIAASGQAKYFQQQVDYNISVSLNDVDNTLTGFEQMNYYNNSSDTLHFIFIHLWANAYKNDRTAFSDQLLENGRTDFYFSEDNKRGYINRLSFKVNGVNAATEDHPQHQDIVKLQLPQALAPGEHIKIETPFHVKLPYNFSRGGHVLQSYQITQWYPKPAVYDNKGWHEMPYLDQGEFYSEFGNFDVQITLPENYVVAATGNLQTAAERRWLKTLSAIVSEDKETSGKKNSIKKDSGLTKIPASAAQIKTLHYTQKNVHDFAWFADKRFIVKADTLKLESGRVIDVIAYILPVNAAVWKNSINNIKKSVITKSKWIGEYPYDVVSVVDNAASAPGGMEYPTITLLTAGGSPTELESVINHEVGHNWFYGIIASNERAYPWMDEGINTYYDKRYEAESETAASKEMNQKGSFFKQRMPDSFEKNLLETTIKIKRDQPINIPADQFSCNI